MRSRHIALLTILGILILSSCEAANDLDRGEPTYQGAESSVSESSIEQEAPSGTEPQSAPENPLEDAELMQDLYLQTMSQFEGVETLEFKRFIFEDSEFSVTLPDAAVLLSEGEKTWYYDGLYSNSTTMDTPDIALFCPPNSAFFAFSFVEDAAASTDSKVDIMSNLDFTAKDATFTAFTTGKLSDQDTVLIAPSTMEADGKQFGYAAYMYGRNSRAGVVYQTELNGRLLRGSFTCELEGYDSWAKILKSIMASIRDKEQTLIPDVKRESELWAKDSLQTAHVDFSLPPEQRRVEYRNVKLVENGITFNEILWLLRGEEDYRSKPIMGEIYRTEDKNRSYHINITDDSFTGSEAYFNDVINTALRLFGTDFFGMYVVIERNGILDTSLPVYEGNLFNFIDYEKAVDYLYTHDEIIQLQHEIPYVPMAFDSVFPMFSEEALAALSAEKRAELESLWLGNDETSHRLITYLSSVMTSLVDYETLSFTSPDEAPDEFILRTAWLATNSVSLSDAEDDNINQQALEVIRNLDRNYSYSCLLGEHVEETARLIFGDSVKVTHMSLYGKTWGYHHYGHYYTHFPGGSGDRYLGGIYPYYMGYQDLGDRYEVSILLVNSSALLNDGAPFLRNIDVEITPENAYELLTKHALRAKVTLLKRADGSLQYQAYEPLGTPSV